MIRQRTQGGVDLILSYPLIDRYLLSGVLHLKIPDHFISLDWVQFVTGHLAHVWRGHCPYGMTRIENTCTCLSLLARAGRSFSN